ncbi:MAG: GTPase [Lachnospiraceae bacterium]|nr:GTPase [Lachnospiraceae bacterium]
MGTVFFVNGFLEAGKTTFIKDLLHRPSFRIRGKTLLLVCEEGEAEYDASELEEAGTVLEIITEEEDFNEEILASLEKKHRPDRVIVEYNGMWDRANLIFPSFWDDLMEIAVFDATTFQLYAENLRSLLAEQVRRAELILFHKADEMREHLAVYARNIKAINGSAAIVFRGRDGDITPDPEELLPYDLREDELVLDDIGFVALSMDAHERCELYEGKQVKFIAPAYRLKDEDLQFVAGRRILTCCEADLAFAGILCGYPKARELQDKEWVEVAGTLKVIYDEEMERRIPVCRVKELKRGIPAGEEIISLL